MNYLSRFISLCVLLFTVGCTHADTQATLPDLATDGLSPIHTDGTCHYRAKVEPGQMFEGRTFMFLDAKPAAWGFGWNCYAGASPEEVANTLAAAQTADGKWTWGVDGPSFERAQHFKTYPIEGKNWAGRVVEFNDTTGEPVRRTRHYNFCLYETGGPQIVCGQVQESLRDPKLGSQFRKALAVIKTIVFVDSPVE